MSVLRYFLPNGGDILLNFTHTMDFFAEWKAADSENNFLYHLFWFLYYNNQFKMHNNFKQTKSKRTGQSPLIYKHSFQPFICVDCVPVQPHHFYV